MSILPQRTGLRRPRLHRVDQGHRAETGDGGTNTVRTPSPSVAELAAGFELPTDPPPTAEPTPPPAKIRGAVLIDVREPKDGWILWMVTREYPGGPIQTAGSIRHAFRFGRAEVRDAVQVAALADVPAERFIDHLKQGVASRHPGAAAERQAFREWLAQAAAVAYPDDLSGQEGLVIEGGLWAVAGLDLVEAHRILEASFREGKTWRDAVRAVRACAAESAIDLDQLEGKARPVDFAKLATEYWETWYEAVALGKEELHHQAEVERLEPLGTEFAEKSRRSRQAMVRAILQMHETPVPDPDRWHFNPAPLAWHREGSTLYLVSPAAPTHETADAPLTFVEMVERSVLTVFEEPAPTTTPATTASPSTPSGLPDLDGPADVIRLLADAAAARFQHADAHHRAMFDKTWNSVPDKADGERWRAAEKLLLDAWHEAEQALAYRIDEAREILRPEMVTTTQDDFFPFGMILNGTIYMVNHDPGDLKTGTLTTIAADRIIGLG